MDLISQLVGTNATDAQELASATVATTRSAHEVPEDEQPVALGGAIGTVRQTLDRSRTLRLTWHGGRSPFQVDLAPVSTGPQPRHASSDTRLVVFDLADEPAGSYRLTINAANDSRLSLLVKLGPTEDIPVAPHLDAAATDDQKELMQAVWLLMRQGPKWHMEALSRLQTLADLRGDAVAKSIVTP